MWSHIPHQMRQLTQAGAAGEGGGKPYATIVFDNSGTAGNVQRDGISSLN